jgi:hypothetical protein
MHFSAEAGADANFLNIFMTKIVTLTGMGLSVKLPVVSLCYPSQLMGQDEHKR